VYNDTATRQLHWIVNGKNSTRKEILIKGYRCVGSCLGETDDQPLENEFRRWSKPESWASGKVPV
jgi:hypothetical protein